MRWQNLHKDLVVVGCAFVTLLCIFLYTVYADRERVQPAYIAIIPHHDMVASMRRAFLTQTYAKARSVRHVIILSPNHFNTGPHPITTTDSMWHDNKPLPLFRVAQQLSIPVHPDAFAYEHGVRNVLPDLVRTFSTADFIALIVKHNAPKEELQTITQRLLNICRADCVVIGSVDFSHEKTAQEAATLDDVTESLLANVEPDELLQRGEADSPEILYILASLAQQKGLAWRTFARTHSGTLLGEPLSRDTTSHILGTYSANK